MTRKEFEALLLKKGFKKAHNYSYYEIGDETIFMTINEFCKNSFNFIIEGESYPIKCFQNVGFLTEHKLDEILSQFTKMKTALEMINHIAKGE